MSEMDVDGLFKEIDADGSGDISFMEFIKWRGRGCQSTAVWWGSVDLIYTSRSHQLPRVIGIVRVHNLRHVLF